jgi:hypothetical protein
MRVLVEPHLDKMSVSNRSISIPHHITSHLKSRSEHQKSHTTEKKSNDSHQTTKLPIYLPHNTRRVPRLVGM